MARGALLLGHALLLAAAASVAKADEFPPTVNLGDGAFTLKPEAYLQIDGGLPFGRSQSDVASGGVNDRRARLGVGGTILRDLHYDLRWDFGGSPGSRNRLYESSLTYHGPENLRLEAGVFEPAFSLQQDNSSKDLLFLERAAVIRAFSGIGAASSSTAAEARAYRDRWFGALSISAGGVGAGNDSSQRAGNVRLAGRAVATDAVSLHLGASGTYAWRPPRGTDGSRGLSLSQPPEFNVARQVTPGPAFSAASDIGVLGGEFGLGWRRLLLQGEYYGLRADRATDPALTYTGYYVQLAFVVVGEPRHYQPHGANWSAPGQDGKGAVEIGARFSRLDLDSGNSAGGVQDVATLGVGWWPVASVAVSAELERIAITGLTSRSRRFDALAVRLQAGF